MAWEVSMVHLHETSNPERDGQIDAIGWAVVTFAIVVTAIASMAAYVAWSL
jgi:hypothetical protein